MRRRTWWLAAGLAAAVLAPVPARATDPRDVRVGLSRVASGIDFPTAVVSARDASGRLFVAERQGRIRIWRSSGLRPAPFLDIRGRVNDGGTEQGLLGLAFHPSYPSNGYVFVAYTDAEGDLRVSRFRAAPPSSNTADASSERIVIQVPHRDFTNHNGGQLQFGERYLYIATGDGGGGGDPGGNAQDTGSLLGKILRLDVDRSCSGRNYCDPATNPFYGDRPGRGEIWHFGLRNPWRFAFDRVNDYTMWIADVGQDAREEIDRATSGGLNFGWDCREGTLDTSDTYGGSYCDGRRFVAPVREYSIAGERCAVIGGYVYRGRRYADLLARIYLYADYCTGEIWGLGRVSGSYVNALVADHSGQITSFGEGETSELYVVDAGGGLYRVTASPR